MYDEKVIANHIKVLGISREDAIKLIDDDKAVDRMKDSEVNNDLTAEQQKVIKKTRQADRKPTAYKFDKKPKKANESKKELIDKIVNALSDTATDIAIINDEREFTFNVDNVKYKIVLSCPRT